MNLTELNRKYILTGVIIFVLAGILVANILANKQDQQFMQNNLLYEQSIQLMNEGDFVNAYPIIQEVIKNQPNSADANYSLALIAANINEFKQAANAMQKALDLNPYKVEEPNFMLQFGEILFSAEQIEDAQIVLLECQKQGWMPEEYPNYQQRVTELLAQIETK